MRISLVKSNQSRKQSYTNVHKFSYYRQSIWFVRKEIRASKLNLNSGAGF